MLGHEGLQLLKALPKLRLDRVNEVSHYPS